MDLESIKAAAMTDTRGLSCPMPLLKTKKALKGLKTDEVLEILGDDPGSKNDIPEFGAKNGNEFIGMLDLDAGYTRFFIKKG